MSAPEAATRTIEGLQVSTAVAGAGRPVVALHGWGADLRSFWPVADRMAPLGYEVHVLDLPGFGQSQPPPSTWGIGDYTRFVVSFLESAALVPVAVIGHSFGGRIALMLAANYPNLVSKMVLANSAGLRTPLSARQYARQWAARSVGATLTTLGLSRLRGQLQDSYNRRFASEDFLAAGPLRDTFLRVIQEDITPFAVRVQAPTLLIWGDQDQDTPLWQGRRLEQLIPDAGLVVFQGAGHFSYLDRLNDFVRIVHHFLRTGS